MNYKKLIKKVAEHYHTTPAQVDKEIKKAIQLSGYTMSPERFIKMCIEKTK